MRQDIMDSLRTEFDGELSEGVKSINFNFDQDSYNPTNGLNSVGNPGLKSVRGLVNGFTAMEVAKSDGRIAETDLKITVIDDEMGNLPELNSTATIGLQGYKIVHIATDTFGASHVMRFTQHG